MSDAEILAWLSGHPARMEAVNELLRIARDMRPSDHNTSDDLRAAVEWCVRAYRRAE